jgi:hypothetical protein
MATCSPSELVQSGKCFLCLDSKQASAVITVLLCRLVQAQNPSYGCHMESGAGSPVGVTTPGFLGQLYHDTTADTYYRSTGLTSADWVEISGGVCPIISDVGPMDLCIEGSTTLSGDVSFPNLTSDFGDFGILIALLPNVTGIDFPSLVSMSSLLSLQGNPLLSSFQIPLLVSLVGLSIGNNPQLTSLVFPSLVTNLGNMDVASCPILSTFSAPLWVPADATTINFTGDALNASSVELILRRCVLAGVTTCAIDLSGGTNAGVASLNAQGQADVVTLGAQLVINP